MAVLATYTDFRERFARRVTSTGSYTFTASGGTITRGSGSFVTDGIEPGMAIVASGTTSNDGILFFVDTVAALTITLMSEDGVTDEGPVATTLAGVHIDPDGQVQFPGATSSQNLVRANSFDGGLTGSTTTFEGVAVEITANSGAADASPGVDEYDWYLSQRTDDAASQYFALTQKADSGGDTFSGTVELTHTALATSVYGVSPNTITVEAFLRLLTHVHLYCRRKSDGAIQWAPLLETMMPS